MTVCSSTRSMPLGTIAQSSSLSGLGGATGGNIAACSFMQTLGGQAPLNEPICLSTMPAMIAPCDRTTSQTSAPNPLPLSTPATVPSVVTSTPTGSVPVSVCAVMLATPSSPVT